MKQSISIDTIHIATAVGAMLFFSSLSTPRAWGDEADFVAKAEAAFEQKSYSDAHALFEQAKAASGSAPWLEFRLADSEWRAAASAEQADRSKLEAPRVALEKMVRDVQRNEQRDRTWAEIQESIGDWYWTRRGDANWSAAWPWYQRALDWWAGTDDLDLARQRYLSIVWRLSHPEWADRYSRYGNYENALPMEVAENALRIAQTDEDKTRAHYLVACGLSRSQSSAQTGRIASEFEAALQSGKSAAWYDDALMRYAQWAERQGRVITNAAGALEVRPDYVTALNLYRRLTKEFTEGETRYYNEAKAQAGTIAEESVAIFADNYFLPDSEIELNLSWRNTKRVDVALYPVRLTTDVQMRKDTDWLKTIDLSGKSKAATLQRVTNDQGDHQLGSETIRLPNKLPMGAYVAVAKSGSKEARAFVLVTDTALMVKISGAQVFVWYCDAITGRPIDGAQLTLWRQPVSSDKPWTKFTDITASNGIASFELPDSGSRQILVAAAKEDRQAIFENRYYYWRSNPTTHDWRIYVYTDRAAYRPGDLVQWKAILRSRFGNEDYTTPASAKIRWHILDPQQTKVASGSATLNDFGSMWDELSLTEKNPLGLYVIVFTDEQTNTLGSATLFRLEEYKLPEFKVSVTTPEKDGRPQIFRLGDTVTAKIRADYYFGGPVANAEVKVIARARPFKRWWGGPWVYGPDAWLYRDFRPTPNWYGRDHTFKEETLRTDVNGEASISFEAPWGDSDLEFEIEARVTDSSRREIVGSGTVRVGRDSYAVNLAPERRIYKPKDSVSFKATAKDLNDHAVVATGVVTITRQQWKEIWIGPDGTEIAGPELRAARRAAAVWPPPVTDLECPWRQKFSGYESEVVLTRTVGCDSNGIATFSFSPEKEGYYLATWNSPQDRGAPVSANADIWVSTDHATELGYRSAGNLELIVDSDTFRVGEKAPVLLMSDVGDRWVLFSIEAKEMLDWQVAHLDGTTKFVQIPVTDSYVPNIYLSVAGFSDGTFDSDTKQVIVPPEKNYLNIGIEPDRADYEPRGEVSLKITATDHENKPVRAELGLAVSDDSVSYIQEALAGDPREFFYGDLRRHSVQTMHSLSRRKFARLSKPLPVESESYSDEILLEKASAPLVMSGMYAGRSSGGRDEFAVYDLAGDSRNAEMLDAAYAAPMAAEAMPSEESAVTVIVRTNFSATAFWKPDVVTDEKGQAEVSLKLPDSLTTWRTTARAATTGHQFGISNITFTTHQPLMARLQAPRFFVVGDTCTVRVVLNNSTDKSLQTEVAFAITGLQADTTTQSVTVPPNGEAVVDCPVAAVSSGTSTVRVTATSGRYADAMEKSYPVLEHGIEKFVATSTKLTGDSASLTLNLPAERRAGSATFTVQVAPSIATTMLDALPYLANYPYGCTEQTMSRFLPSVIAAGTLKKLGLPADAVANKLFGGVEAATAAKRTNTLDRLDEMAQAGLNRLRDMQHADGAWGWWKEGESDPWMTAYVLWGLALADSAGLDVRDSDSMRAVEWLEKKLVEAEDQPDLQAWEAFALSAHKRQSKLTATAMERLWASRDKLNAYTRALFLLATVNYGDPNHTAAILARNLRDGVIRDTQPESSLLPGGSTEGEQMGTAHWGSGGSWWRWSENGIESTAFALKALLAVEPNDQLADEAMTWLVRNRRGAQWNNTRDTAIVLLALADFIKVRHEAAPNLECEIAVNGATIATQQLTSANAFEAPGIFVAPDSTLVDGTNIVTVTRRGEGPLYVSASATYFSLEEPISASGHEIFARRQYFRITTRPTLLKGVAEEIAPLQEGDTLQSGDRIEVVLNIEAKNDCEYLMFEDLKPAGLEAVDIRSGESLYARELKPAALDLKRDTVDYTGRTRWIYRELRDQKVALFADRLPQGLWEIRYTLRAETPGAFHALPTLGQAMYVPEIHCNSSETRLSITP